MISAQFVAQAAAQAPAYSAIVSSLAHHLLQTAEAFLLTNGCVFAVEGFERQASTSMTDVARELVNFGADRWPDDLPSSDEALAVAA